MTLSICFGCWPELVCHLRSAGRSIIKDRDVGFSPGLTMQTRQDHNDSIQDKKSHKGEITKFDNSGAGRFWQVLVGRAKR